MYYQKALKISIIFLYLIIVAGAVVRMTGSGMGCPDWPKCFGYLVPPTEEGELEWKADFEYDKGQIIIVSESLRIAPANFTSDSTYQESNWSTYDAHDYATFNVWNTWIEYINRLVTALAGIPMLLMFIFSFRYWKGRPWLIFGSFFVLPLMGFQAWLGKIVVDSNLFPVKITIHMIAALFILALLLYLWFKLKEKEQIGIEKVERKAVVYDPLFMQLMFIATLLTLVQIGLGTQVRQYVDERVGVVGYEAKQLWMDPVTLWFYVHRSFSILVTLLTAYIYWRNKTKELGHKRLLDWVLIFIGIEVISGIAMYYIDFPFGTQPIHLVLATLLFGAQFYVLLESMRSPIAVGLKRS
tara:strand:- start:4323 stop:5387 length:1065 start_codon:yes stop_codon:yes gene_type:complete